MNDSLLEAAIRRRKPGFALESCFYNSAEIFARDVDQVIARSWQIVGHESQIPLVGDYMEFQVAGESLIVTRSGATRIQAFYNVCRHRGSRLVSGCGHVGRLVCPYHAWSYSLDGRLVAARMMPEGFQKKDHSLREARVACVEGLIFVSLSDAGESRTFIDECVPYLKYYGIADTKVAFREVFDIAANWKLVVENFIECYHCGPTHPEYCAVNMSEFVDGLTTFHEESRPADEKWRPRGDSGRPADGFPAGKYPAASEGISCFFRKQLRAGYLTASENGRGLAPLLGSVPAYDGTSSLCIFNPFCWLGMLNDHAIIFQITPIAPLRTRMEAVWMVRKDAVEGVDYTEDRLTWLWRKTLEQDKRIVNANQEGTGSRAYQPGPYSLQEEMTDALIVWYLGLLSAPSAPARRVSLA